VWRFLSNNLMLQPVARNNNHICGRLVGENPIFQLPLQFEVLSRAAILSDKMNKFLDAIQLQMNTCCIAFARAAYKNPRTNNIPPYDNSCRRRLCLPG
jgi:hypothetical protein